MKFFLFGVCLFFSFVDMAGQSQSLEKRSDAIEIFKKEEVAYVENWIANLITEARLDEETVSRFKIITSFYGLKMKQIGEGKKLTKIEIIDQFNILVKQQSKELEQVLPTEQFQSFSKFYDKLSWSVNKRLNQL